MLKKLLKFLTVMALPCGVFQAFGTDVAWPSQWTVFGPFDAKEPPVSVSGLKTVPGELTVGGKKRKANIYNVKDAFGRLNLEGILDNPDQAAYVFLKVSAEKDIRTKIGVGADWWFQAWLDGSPVMDTLKDGNGQWPPSVMDHQAAVDLSKGDHVIALRFVRGSGSAILAAGGEELIKKGKPNFALPLFKNPVVSKNNIAVNGDFEKGLTGWEDMSQKNSAAGKVFTVESAAPITGKNSLAVNSMAGADSKNKLVYKLPPMKGVYFITFSGRYFEGEYAGVSIRRGAGGGPTYALFAAGDADTPGSPRAAKGERQSYKTYCYVDEDEPCLVIDARRPCRVQLDNFCVEPCADESKVWSAYPHQKVPFDREWSELTANVITPHVQWAATPVCEQTKVLSIMPRWRQRQAIELGERFGFQFDPAMFGSGEAAGPDYWIRDADQEPSLYRVKEETVKKIDTAPDCMLISFLKTSAIDKELFDAVLRRVESGAGLVVTGEACGAFSDKSLSERSGEKTAAVTDDGFIITSVDSGEKGSCASGRVCMTLGRGRIVLLPDCSDYNSARERQERQDCLIAKAVMWACSKTPPVRLGKPSLIAADGSATAKLEIAREKLPSALSVPVTGNPSGVPVKVSAWIDNYGVSKTAGLERLETPKTPGSVSFRLPVLPVGTYDVCFQLEDGKTSADWTIARIKVSGDSPIGRIKIDPPTGRQYHIRGETVSGKALFARPLAAGLSSEIRLEDADGNVWASKEFPGAGQTSVDFSFQTGDLKVLSNKVTVTVSDSKGVLAEKGQRVVCVPGRAGPRRMDYQHWSLPGIKNCGYIGCLVAAEMREQGVSTAMCGSVEDALSENNIRNIGTNWPWGWHWGPNKVTIKGDPEKSPEFSPSLCDPVYRQRYPETVEKYIKPVCAYGQFAFCAAHEENLLGQCGAKEINADFSPPALASLREFLKKEHGSLSELNKAWGTSFASWEDVRPCSVKEAAATGQAGRWIDHRRHMDRVYSEFMRFRREIVRRWDSEAEIFADNFRETTSYSGLNYWELLQTVAGVGGFPDSYVSSFMPENLRGLAGKHAASWTPGIISDNRRLLTLRLQLPVWRNLLSGYHTYSYYSEIFSSSPTSMMYGPLCPDLRPSWVGKTLEESFARVHSGIDRMIFESLPGDSSIGVLYSRSSELAADLRLAAGGGKPAGKVMTARFQEEAYHAILRSMGYGYHSFAEEQIAAGELKRSPVKILILPFSQTIPSAAAEEIRDWVKGGGVLLAGIWPAIRDVHGSGREKGLLDDVFGVTQNVPWSSAPVKTESLRLTPSAKSLNFGGVIQNVFVGGGVSADTAAANGAAGSNPVLMVNNFGKGRTVLLNFAPATVSGGLSELLKKLLGEAGVKPLFTAEIKEPASKTHAKQPLQLSGAADGEAPADAEGFLGGKITGLESKPVPVDFSRGGTHVFGFWFNDRGGVSVRELRVTPPVKGHVYNLITNEYLGEPREFTARIPAEGFALFAVTPARVNPPSAEARFSDNGGSQKRIICRAKIAGQPDGADDLIIQFRLFRPDGSEWRDMAATERLRSGAAEHSFVLPLNAPRGQWRVKVREAVSGLSAESVCSVN